MFYVKPLMGILGCFKSYVIRVSLNISSNPTFLFCLLLSHQLNSFYLLSPQSPFPHLTSPCLTSPLLTSLHLISHYLSSPLLTSSSHFTSPHISADYLEESIYFEIKKNSVTDEYHIGTPIRTDAILNTGLPGTANTTADTPAMACGSLGRPAFPGNGCFSTVTRSNTRTSTQAYSTSIPAAPIAIPRRLVDGSQFSSSVPINPVIPVDRFNPSANPGASPAIAVVPGTSRHSTAQNPAYPRQNINVGGSGNASSKTSLPAIIVS